MPRDAFARLCRHHELTMKLIGEIRSSAKELRRAAERSRLLLAESQQTLRRASREESHSRESDVTRSSEGVR